MAELFKINVEKSFYFDDQQGNFNNGGDLSQSAMRFTFHHAPLINVHEGDSLFLEGSIGDSSNYFEIKADMNGQIEGDGILSVKVFIKYLIPSGTSKSWSVMLYGSLPFTFTAYAPL